MVASNVANAAGVAHTHIQKFFIGHRDLVLVPKDRQET